MNSFRTVAILLLLLVSSAFAQTGFPPFGSFENGSFDVTNRQNLNTSFAIPITSSSGRGMTMNLALVYNSFVYSRGLSAWSPLGTGADWGWKMMSPFGDTGYTYTAGTCIDPTGLKVFGADHYYHNYTYTDGNGTLHVFTVVVHEKFDCGWGYSGVYTGHAADNSGYYIDITPPEGMTNPTVYSPSGVKMAGAGIVSQVTDANGNYVTRSVASNVTTWTDTLNRAAVTITDNRTATPPTMVYGFPAENGSTLTVQVNYTAYNIHTNFSCSGFAEYSASGVLLPTQIVFLPGDPHQLTYSISYEDTPGFTGYKTGRLSQVTLPTGGYYQYQYYASPANPAVDHGGVDCSSGGYVYLTKVINDGVTSSAWSFVRNVTAMTTRETPPSVSPDSGAHAVYTFNASGQQTSAVFYADAAETTKLKTVNTTWATNGTPASQVTILDNNKQSKVTTNFDSSGMLQSVGEYDYGNGAVGPLIRTTTLTYVNDSAHLAKNMLQLVSRKTITDGAGTTVQRTDFTYDCYSSPCAPLASSGYTGVAHHDDTNYGSANTVRGNLTQSTTYANAAAGTGGLTMSLAYNILGNLLSSTDPKGNTTTFSYADSWNNATCAPVGGAYAFQTSTTNAAGQTSSSRFNSCTGTLASVTGANGNTTSLTYDNYRRPLTSAFPDGGSASVSYTDGANPVISATQAIDAGKTLSTSSHMDGLGRVVQTTTSTPSGAVYVDTAYDARGNVASVSNPHYSTSSPTDGTTTFLYDGLGRQVQSTNPDGTIAHAAFSGSAVALADEGNGNANPVEKLSSSMLSAAFSKCAK